VEAERRPDAQTPAPRLLRLRAEHWALAESRNSVSLLRLILPPAMASLQAPRERQLSELQRWLRAG